MAANMNQLSESELHDVIAVAEKALKAKKDGKRKGVLAQIRQLAASIDVSVEIKDARKSGRRGMKVPPKYRNPVNPLQEWTGRGMQPGWVRDLIREGYSLEQLKIKS